MDKKIQENEKVKEEKSNAFIEVVNEIIDTLPIPDGAKKVAKKFVDKVSDFVSDAWDTFTSWF